MQKEVQVRAEMFSLITSWRQSRLSQKGYCEQHNIRYHVFHYWYKCYPDLQTYTEDEGFITLKFKPFVNDACAYVKLLFAEGKRLLFHRPVSIDYLKALIS
jgi:hypothetical protein